MNNQSQSESTGAFAGFILLETPAWDTRRLQEDLDAWGICCPETALSGQDSLVWDMDGALVAVSLMSAPVPNGEAQRYAECNYMWPQAVEVTKTHEAHLMVAVMGRALPPLEAGKLYVKLCAACLKQPGALGVYTSGTVFQPEFYLEAAEMLRDGGLPILNLVFLGLYRSEGGMNGYTYGMNAFGKDEIEILDSKAAPAELRNFLYRVAGYVLEYDVTLLDGETIGFSEDQKFSISRSAGVAVDGDSLKIQF